MSHPLSLLAPIAQTVNTGARFASLTYTAKGTGEKARHTVQLGVSLENAYQADIATLQAKRATLQGVDAIACDELLASLRESLDKGIGNNSAYTCADTYTQIAKGIRAHKETGALYITGASIQKAVIVPGVHKVVKSSEKTIAKNALRRELKSGKIRTFALDEIHSAKMNGETLEFD